MYVSEIKPAVPSPAADPQAIVQDIINFRRCFICQKYIGNMVDIYLYMDKGFCSNECRSKEMDKVDTEVKPKINPAKMKRVKRSRKDYTPVRAPMYKKKDRD